MCFVWISEQTAIISLYSINWLVFTTEAGCVYCAIWTVSLNVIQCNSFQNAQEVHNYACAPCPMLHSPSTPALRQPAQTLTFPGYCTMSYLTNEMISCHWQPACVTLHILTSHSNTNDKLVSTAADSLPQPLINPLHWHRKKAAFIEAKSNFVVMLLVDASSTVEDARGKGKEFELRWQRRGLFKDLWGGRGKCKWNRPQCSAHFRFMWPCIINVGEERTNGWHK